MTQPRPFRHGTNVQFRWVRRWFLIFPYAKLQFREKHVWRSVEDGMIRDNADWSGWHDIFTETEEFNEGGSL